MAKNDNLLEVEGQILEILPNQMFKVKIEPSSTVIVCYTGGRMRQNKIRLVTGDRVRIEISAYDLTKGRITFRM